MFGSHINRHLTAYHHGELSSSERARVEAHLLKCVKCREAYDEIQLGARLASALSLSTAPDSTWSEVPRVPQVMRPRWLPQTVLAGAVAIAAVVLFIRTQVPMGPSW